MLLVAALRHFQINKEQKHTDEHGQRQIYIHFVSGVTHRVSLCAAMVNILYSNPGCGR